MEINYKTQEAIKIPFGKYKNFAECVAEQKKKGFSDDRAGRVCASIHKKITGKWPTEMAEIEDQIDPIRSLIDEETVNEPEMPSLIFRCVDCNNFYEEKTKPERCECGGELRKD